VGITQPRVGFIPAAHALSTRLMTWLISSIADAAAVAPSWIPATRVVMSEVALAV